MPNFRRVYPKWYDDLMISHTEPCKKIEPNYYLIIRGELYKVYTTEPIGGKKIKIYFKDQEPLIFGQNEEITIPMIEDADCELISIGKRNLALLRNSEDNNEIEFEIDDESPFGADLLEDYKNGTIKKCTVRRIRWGDGFNITEKFRIIEYHIEYKNGKVSFEKDPFMEDEENEDSSEENEDDNKVDEDKED